ncbi:hypothetical protein P22_0182 [Propionispora sp. 2/2-37]|uniref:D-aminoacyl-tRNA deacylase n=1 Tax=Propionispora sp. 2/2-37 TaxID=1677858 RepID=UPI0006BB965C|nr:D-aminoacyl-tRNA deacylase [Propionispora sp. 2/2-37]CUH94120.1 hypothetical protein P22_0182 [Propionispora sp. 2/2-37]
MRAVVQLTDSAEVWVDSQLVGSIERGLTVLLGVETTDTAQDVVYLAEKIVNLRIFPDDTGKMNVSLVDIKGELLVVSQFTLLGDCRKGRRPGFDRAAPPALASILYDSFIEQCSRAGIRVASGKFRSDMVVRLSNHGPVTVLLDSKRNF